MTKQEINEKKLLVSAILFTNKVPVEDAKVIGSFIEELERMIDFDEPRQSN